MQHCFWNKILEPLIFGSLPKQVSNAIFWQHNTGFTVGKKTLKLWHFAKFKIIYFSTKIHCKIQNHQFRVVSFRNFFLRRKKTFFAHRVKSDIIVQDMQNCFKSARVEQIDFHLIFCTDWFSCKKTGIWLLMFYARLVSQQ